MAFEMSAEKAICTRCGTAYSSRRGFFPASHAILYKGLGSLPVCKDCVDAMYVKYLDQCGSVKDAVRQMCRKLDLYWSEEAFNSAINKSTARSVMTRYLTTVNTMKYMGKSYDDTLIAEGTLWGFLSAQPTTEETEEGEAADKTQETAKTPKISKAVKAFWGSGYTPEMYVELEQRRQYWMSKFPRDAELDIGTEAIIRQICSLELDINRDRAAGRPVEKSITALNTLLGSANLKPVQKKEEGSTAADNTPFGVWIKRWEDQRPVPEPDPELKDVDGIVRYIEIWFKGHLSKMLGLKNSYSKMYQAEIDKIKVELPEYEDEDDETVFNDIFGGGSIEQ